MAPPGVSASPGGWGRLRSSLQMAGFWREAGVASNHSLALNAPNRVEGLLLAFNGSSLVVEAAYNK